MLFKILIVCLCFISVIQSKMITTYNLNLVSDSRNCSLPHELTLIDGQPLTILISPHVPNYGWCRRVYADSSPIEYHSQPFQNFTIPKVNISIEGIWEFELLFHKNNMDTRGHIVVHGDANYTQNICRTNVTIVPSAANNTSMSTEMYIIIVAVIVSLIIIAQTIYIIYLRGRARAITRHRNLSKHSDLTSDKARYCSNPGQKVMKVPPIVDMDRESVIYHVPQIEMTKRDPVEPPQPPAVHTIPRSPRQDNMARMGEQALLAAAMQGSVNPPVANGTFPRNQPQINVANRPRLPLPNDTYEEMEMEENTYEPPPIINKLQQRPQVLPFVPPPIKNAQSHIMIPFETNPNKSVLPKSEQLPPGRLPVLQKGVRPHLNHVAKLPMKPAATPKPQTLRPEHNMAPIKELENIWKNRNVVPVPIQTIPEPNTSKGTIQKPKPAPAPKTKPPVPIPVQEEIYCNERQDSSDEEWTYEPLKHFNTDNIYNI